VVVSSLLFEEGERVGRWEGIGDRRTGGRIGGKACRRIGRNDSQDGRRRLAR